MKKAFTLLELMLVMGLMGLLGTVTVIGFRQVQRGMAERGAMDNVDQFIRAAYQRAQIDRCPMALYFWNELQKPDSDDAPLQAVGKACAVRRIGRISGVVGNYLVDEFGPLKASRYETPDEADRDDEDKLLNDRPSPGMGNGFYLYLMRESGGKQCSLVGSVTVPQRRNEFLVNSVFPEEDEVFVKDAETKAGEVLGIEAYAYEIVAGQPNFWKTGDVYGIEVLTITLPENFIFGSSYSKTISSPVTEIASMWINPGVIAGNGAAGGSVGTVRVSRLLPDGSGALVVNAVGTSTDPTQMGGKR